MAYPFQQTGEYSPQAPYPQQDAYPSTGYPDTQQQPQPSAPYPSDAPKKHPQGPGYQPQPEQQQAYPPQYPPATQQDPNGKRLLAWRQIINFVINTQACHANIAMANTIRPAFFVRRCAAIRYPLSVFV